MSNKKKWTLASLIIIVLAVIAGIGYGVGHKDTANTLQSHEWALTNNGQTQTAKFDKSNHLSVGQGDMKYSYSYKISKKNDHFFSHNILFRTNLDERLFSTQTA